MISDKKPLNLQSDIATGKASFSIRELNSVFLNIFIYGLTFISLNVYD